MYRFGSASCSLPPFFLNLHPIDIDARILGDKGKPIVLEKPNCEVTNSFKSIVNLIEEHYQKELQTKLV